MQLPDELRTGPWLPAPDSIMPIGEPDPLALVAHPLSEPVPNAAGMFATNFHCGEPGSDASKR